MENAAARVGSFLTPERLAARIAVKLYACGFLQDLMKNSWPFLGQQARRTGGTHPGARGKYVGKEDLRIVIQSPPNDSTLRITRV